MVGSEVSFIAIIFCFSAIFSKWPGVLCAITLTELELKKICQGYDFQFVAHPTKQENYIICVPGGGVERECATGQCYDEVNPPCSTNCITNTHVADQTTKDYCNQADTPLLDRVANDQDCASYYICVGRNVDPLSQICPRNQHYAEEHKTCLNYDEANCAPSTKWCKKRKDGTRFAHRKCYEYYECKNERTANKPCSYGEHFDRDLLRCVSGICPQDNRTPDCQNKKDGLRTVHAKCYKYFVCLNQSLFEAQCASGYYFDKIQNKCVRDVNNVCEDTRL